MSERLIEKLGSIAGTDTLDNAILSIEATGKSANYHANRLARVGQPAFASHFVVLAFERGEIDSNQAAEIMAVSFENLAGGLENTKKPKWASVSIQLAAEWRELISK